MSGICVYPLWLRIFLSSGIFGAARLVFTVRRTSSEPASASSMICLAVDLASEVSVLVMDWIAIGFSPPILTLPICTSLVHNFILVFYVNGLSKTMDY